MIIRKICEDCPDYCKECLEDNQVKYVLEIEEYDNPVFKPLIYAFTSLESLADFVLNMDHWKFGILRTYSIDCIDFVEPME